MSLCSRSTVIEEVKESMKEDNKDDESLSRKSTNHNSSLLPSPQKRWDHGVTSRSRLRGSLTRDATAIETDVILGHCMSCSTKVDKIPVHAHPPNRVSDLSMLDFWNTILNSADGTINKVVKLDFKEMPAVEPSLRAIVDLNLTTSSDAAIFLNADVLPGPGMRHEGGIPDADFLEMCLSYTTKSKARFAFSLGYKTDVSNSKGYTEADVQAMADLIQRYKLTDRIGVVLALNARQLNHNLPVFDSILRQFPELQLLIWTGKGEPAIASSVKATIHHHYSEQGIVHRIGWDVRVTDSYLTSAAGELALRFFGLAEWAYTLVTTK